jgi:hypothetical protein
MGRGWPLLVAASSSEGLARRELVALSLLLALALMALSAGPVEAIQMRFRLPATAFLAVIAAVGWFGSSRDHLARGGTRQKPLL